MPRPARPHRVVASTVQRRGKSRGQARRVGSLARLWTVTAPLQPESPRVTSHHELQDRNLP